MIAPLELRAGGPADAGRIAQMMQQLYAALEMRYTPGVAAAAAQMLGDERLGHIWLIERAGSSIGYATLSRWFSPELEGWTAYLDEIFIAPAFRGQGLGAQAIAQLLERCREQDLRTLRLELEDWNTDAQRLYQRLGFEVEKRKLMTKWL